MISSRSFTPPGGRRGLYSLLHLPFLYLPKEYGMEQISCTNAEGKSVGYMARKITAPVNAISRRLLWLTFENSPDGINIQIKK